MRRFYLSGQRTFENRGCEAIIRSTVLMLNNVFGPVEVLVPSDNIKRDRHQWHESADFGVEFVQAHLPLFTRYWVHFQRLPIPFLKRIGWPFPFPDWLKEQIESVDAILAVGGDNYSLDYRLPSLLMGIDKLAMDMGKPVILWGASVGPFEKEPYFVPAVRQHLYRMPMIAVRETISESYLKENLGLNNVTLMADPAFSLIPEPVSVAAFWPEEQGHGVIGLNVSFLLERYRNDNQNLRFEIMQFIRSVVQEKNMAVLLVPHVVAMDSGSKNNDAVYMQPILDSVRDLGSKVRMIEPTLNAAQIKQVISQCRFFIGARTHSTIAALSSAVPTVSIAYSIKAKGINQDLFGHLDAVLETTKVSKTNLLGALNWLEANESVLRKQLKEKIGAVREQNVYAMQLVRRFIS